MILIAGPIKRPGRLEASLKGQPAGPEAQPKDGPGSASIAGVVCPLSGAGRREPEAQRRAPAGARPFAYFWAFPKVSRRKVETNGGLDGQMDMYTLAISDQISDQ